MVTWRGSRYFPLSFLDFIVYFIATNDSLSDAQQICRQIGMAKIGQAITAPQTTNVGKRNNGSDQSVADLVDRPVIS